MVCKAALFLKLFWEGCPQTSLCFQVFSLHTTSSHCLLKRSAPLAWPEPASLGPPAHPLWVSASPPTWGGLLGSLHLLGGRLSNASALALSVWPVFPSFCARMLAESLPDVTKLTQTIYKLPLGLQFCAWLGGIYVWREQQK